MTDERAKQLNDFITDWPLGSVGISKSELRDLLATRKQLERVSRAAVELRQGVMVYWPRDTRPVFVDKAIAKLNLAAAAPAEEKAQ